jgi:hypothetical protein
MSEDFVPEADLQEQRQPLLDEDDAPVAPEIGPETPAADAWEQAIPVPYDEDEAPR